MAASQNESSSPSTASPSPAAVYIWWNVDFFSWFWLYIFSWLYWRNTSIIFMEYLCSLFWWNVFHNLLWHKMKYERNHSKDYFDRNFFGNLLWILLLYVHWFDLTRRFCPTFIKVSRILTFKTWLEEHVCANQVDWKYDFDVIIIFA